MNFLKAVIKAKKTSKILKATCYVVKFKTPIKWYSISTWFRYENVSIDYLENFNYKGKIYYITKK